MESRRRTQPDAPSALDLSVGTKALHLPPSELVHLVVLHDVRRELLLEREHVLGAVPDALRLARRRRVPHRAHGFVVRVEAKRDARVERGLRLARGVRVRRHGAHHQLPLVVQRCVHAAVADRLGHHALDVLRGRRQPELRRDVRERDGRVSERDAPQADADHVAAQPRHEQVCLVRRERRGVRLRHSLERRQVARAHSLRERRVRRERVACLLRRARASRRGEQVALLRDLSQEQAHDGDPLRELDGEPARRRGRLAVRLLQTRLGLRVLQLHGADATEVVQVAALLRVGARRRRLCLRAQLLRLLVLRVVQVVAQQQVQTSLLPEVVPTRHRRAV
mmetsp:Transcript_11747/g.50325  ORF Transcript_11747/g.50325 Transcript_11747/m.50325 type:complete len:337 (-) Transcript_11747:661-1671(-)